MTPADGVGAAFPSSLAGEGGFRLSEVQLEPGTGCNIAPGNAGRFVHVQRGGVWVSTARRAHCVTLGGGIWMPPSVGHRLYVPYGAALRELCLAPELTREFVHTVRIPRCSGVLASLLTESASQALARSPTAVAGVLFDELNVSPREAGREIVIDLPSPRSRIASLCDAMILDPGRDTRLDAIADRMRVSVRTLHRLFVDEVGVGAGRWRKDVQAGAAACALALGTPVSVIAHDLGFTPSAFSTFFKSRVGWAPNRWLANQVLPAGERIK